MNIRIDTVQTIAQKALSRFGYSLEEASAILDILMYAQLRGNNQGLVKLIGAGIPKDPAAGPMHTIKETKLSSLIDGNRNFGMLVMKQAMDTAIAKAKEFGFGIVGTNNTTSSTGAIGYYANEIAKHQLIGFVYAGSPPTVAPYGSYEALFGTNPLAIGIPADPEPVVLDMATAAMAYYGLVEAKTAGRLLSDEIAYDQSGNLTTDPGKAMDGAIKAFGGHKGSGLGFMITALTGPLVGAAFAGIGDRGDWGNLVYAIDPSLLVPPEQFAKQVSAFISRVKDAKKLPETKDIYVPGERGNNMTKYRLSLGTIDIEDNLYQELLKNAA